MLSTILKRKLSDDQVANIFINAIFDTVDNGFKEVAQMINEDVAFVSSPEIAENFIKKCKLFGEKVSFETGLRADYVINERLYLLPRFATLFKWTDKLSTRIGGGLGYRNASIFNQEAEILGYKNVLAINKNNTKAEQSYGGNADIGYKTKFGDGFSISFNQMFFYTYLDKPLVLNNIGTNFEFRNANGFTKSIGTETFFKLGYDDFTFFVGYTYTDANDVCRLALLSKGEIRTKRCTPLSAFKKP